MSDGTYDDMKGRAKEAVGDLTDDDDLKSEGKVDRAGGSIKDKSTRWPTRSRASSTPTGEVGLAGGHPPLRHRSSGSATSTGLARGRIPRRRWSGVEQRRRRGR